MQSALVLLCTAVVLAVSVPELLKHWVDMPVIVVDELMHGVHHMSATRTRKTPTNSYI